MYVMLFSIPEQLNHLHWTRKIFVIFPFVNSDFSLANSLSNSLSLDCLIYCGLLSRRDANDSLACEQSYIEEES